jgi:thiamine-phosphate pyrophosphorylase
MDEAKWPGTWLVTDERMGEDGLWMAIERLPQGSGLLFRHYAAAERDRLAQRVAEVAHERGLVLCIAGDVRLAQRLGAALVHGPASPPGTLPVSYSVHSLEEADAANRAGAALAFVSPMFATRSHPGRTALSDEEARRIVDRLHCPAIALGGVDERNYAAIKGLGFEGWAGIDAWLRT